jgi:hypothetical protein
MTPGDTCEKSTSWRWAASQAQSGLLASEGSQMTSGAAANRTLTSSRWASVVTGGAGTVEPRSPVSCREHATRRRVGCDRPSSRRCS